MWKANFPVVFVKWGFLLYSSVYTAPWVVGLEANTTISGLGRYGNNFKDEKVRNKKKKKVRNKEQYKTVDFSNFRMWLFRSLLAFSNLVL